MRTVIQDDSEVSMHGESCLYLQNVLYVSAIILIAHTDATLPLMANSL